MKDVVYLVPCKSFALLANWSRISRINLINNRGYVSNKTLGDWDRV